jgi:anti-sigma factor RsiW
MTCTDALDLVEAIAAADMALTDDARDHFETCPRCSAALASARRIEALLAAREAPQAPPRFTSHVLARIRRERWRSEQAVDRLFNFAIVAAVILMAGGVAAVINLSGVMTAATAIWEMLALATSGAMQKSGPSLGTYVGAIGLFVSALAMWWWAEQRLSL